MTGSVVEQGASDGEAQIGHVKSRHVAQAQSTGMALAASMKLATEWARSPVQTAIFGRKLHLAWP